MKYPKELVRSVSIKLSLFGGAARADNKKRKREASNTKAAAVLVLDDTRDILCGRGNVFGTRSPNMLFQKLIYAKLDRYQAAVDRNEKNRVVNGIVRELRVAGLRFLKKEKPTPLAKQHSSSSSNSNSTTTSNKSHGIGKESTKNATPPAPTWIELRGTSKRQFVGSKCDECNHEMLPVHQRL